MKTAAMINMLMDIAKDNASCGRCMFKCKGDGYCVLIALANNLKFLQKDLRHNKQKLRECMGDLKDADMIDCRHCAYYRSGTELTDDCPADCDSCSNDDCGCKTCRDNSNWEWKGLAGVKK